MLKNTATTLIVYCWDATTGLPKTGDAANLTAYRTLDFGTVTVLGDTSAAELDSTNAKGFYKFDLTSGETNGDYNLYTCKSSTSNIVCMAVPALVHTLPATGLLAPTTAGRTLDVSATGEAGLDFDNIKAATGATTLTNITVPVVTTLTGHTAQTADHTANIAAILADSNELQTDWANGGRLDLILDARASQTSVDTIDNFIDTEIADLSSRLPAALGPNGNMKSDNRDWIGTAVATPTVAGVPEVDLSHIGGVADFVASLNSFLEEGLVNGQPIGVNVQQVNGNALAAAPLEDLVVTGYNSTTHKVAGVVLADSVTGMATSTELAKVPKSDSNVTWNATAAAQIQSEANDALVAYDPPTNAEMEARTLAAADYATATALSTLTAIFTGITSLAQWLGLIAGKQTGNSTARTELRATGAGSGTFDETTDSMEAVRDALANQVKKNTAFADFPFKMVLASDHLTPATGLTITATRSIDGGAFASCANSATEISGGWYKLSFASTDLNGNVIAFRFTEATADTTEIVIVTQPT